MARPLDGVRVLEVALYAFVPSAGAVLAEWGAEVIKVEHPLHPDPMRGTAAYDIPAGTGGFTFLWESANRGKRGIAVDLANPEGREIIMRLSEQADVFLTNFLSDARKKLGVDVDDIMARNPRIIYGRGSGQGTSGPDAEEGGFDMLSYWQRSGAAASAKPPEVPLPIRMPGPGFGDVQSGLALAAGIGAALYGREKTGKGSVVDCSLLSCGMWAMQPTILATNLVGRDVLEIPVHTDIGNPLTNTYATSDGRHICLGMMESDRYWERFCEVSDRPDLFDDGRFASSHLRSQNRAVLTEILDDLFAKRTLEEWKEVLRSQEGQWTFDQSPREVSEDVQAVANGYVQDVTYPDGRSLRMVSSPAQFDGRPGDLSPAPEHGANTDEVLLEMGFDWDEIIQLKIDGAIL
jgi:crotonobetainyl-CoA:carnitine CoA-transferase CaiB-like acyl-CoA transferase